MELKIFQKGFNFSQDGPGNRLVYHLYGCNMHCPWCSNPEGMGTVGEYFTATTKDIVEEIKNSIPMFFENGGVTFTGGEATLQFNALKEVLFELKKANISTAIETNGSHPQFIELIPLLDHVIMDFKHPDDVKHKDITGISNDIIKQNISLTAKSGKWLLIRIPLISSFNTDETEINSFLDFFKTLKGDNVKFEILSYHEYGKDKWLQNGLSYKMENAFVTEEEKINFENKLKASGLNVINT